MNIPILKIGNILLTSIQTDLTDNDAIQFQKVLLARVSEVEAGGVVIDITALDVVDSFLARILNETANMVRLLGAEVVMCGMPPSVALTLVEMGRELIGVQAALDLEQALELVKQLIKKQRALAIGDG